MNLHRLTEEEREELTGNYESYVYFPRLMNDELLNALPAIVAPMNTPAIERQTYADQIAGDHPFYVCGDNDE